MHHVNPLLAASWICGPKAPAPPLFSRLQLLQQWQQQGRSPTQWGQQDSYMQQKVLGSPTGPRQCGPWLLMLDSALKHHFLFVSLCKLAAWLFSIFLKTITLPSPSHLSRSLIVSIKAHSRPRQLLLYSSVSHSMGSHIYRHFKSFSTITSSAMPLGSAMEKDIQGNCLMRLEERILKIKILICWNLMQLRSQNQKW